HRGQSFRHWAPSVTRNPVRTRIEWPAGAWTASRKATRPRIALPKSGRFVTPGRIRPGAGTGQGRAFAGKGQRPAKVGGANGLQVGALDPSQLAEREQKCSLKAVPGA